MEVGGASPDTLLQLPWLPVNISGCQLLTKSWFGDASYHLLLTDMNCVWEERMDSAAIQRRAQELNRRLRAQVRAFFSHLCEVAQPCLSGSSDGAAAKAEMSLVRHEDGNISMRLKSEMAEVPFHWEFHCSPAPVTSVCVQLVRPLLLMSRLLHRQVEQLGVLLLRKDAEIQDYRENGATLSRERLQTDVYEEQTHREEFMAKTLPLLCAEQQGDPGLDTDLQNLYAAVVAHGNARKRKVSEERWDEEAQTFTDEPDVTPSSGIGPVTSQSADEEREETQNRKEDATKSKMATRPSVQQAASDRPSSKPKKKKVGLFR